MVSNRLINYYENLEMQFPITFNPDYGNLVVPNGNSADPVHRWFHVKEGFSSRLLQRVLRDTGLLVRPSLSVLDSFVGGGTTVISALSLDTGLKTWPITAYGIERNPFLRFVAETKACAYRFGVPNFREYIHSIIDLSRSIEVTLGPIPELSTFHKEEYFSSKTLIWLLKLRAAIEMSVGTELEGDLAKLCLAGVVEPISALRKDGRALRYVPDKYRPDVLEEFMRLALIVASDVENSSTTLGIGHVYLGDGRNPTQSLPAGTKFNLILFSPPYPNNIDYTEVYKLEACILGFITDKDSFRKQRLLTLRSHPSIRFPDTYKVNKNGHKEDFYSLLAPILNEIPRNESTAWRRRLVVGYFDDLFETLQNHRPLLANNGYLVLVVGNSLHGCGKDRFLIAADIIIARLAEMAGYKVASFVVARELKRRRFKSPLMREVIVFLQKKEDN